MTRVRTPPVESYGPELMAALLRAAVQTYTVPFTYSQAVRFRQRLYGLRFAMRAAKHDQYSLVSRVKITISWPSTVEQEKVGDHYVPKDRSSTVTVQLSPNDSEFAPALLASGVSVLPPSRPASPVPQKEETKMDAIDALMKEI